MQSQSALTQMIKQNRRTWYLQKTSRFLAGSTQTINHSGDDS